MEKLQNEKELDVLIDIYKSHNKTNVLEIGSLHGHTLKEWMNRKNRLQDKLNLLSIDLIVPEHDHRYKEQYDGHTKVWKSWAIENGVRFEVINNYSLLQETIDEVKNFFNGQTIDFIFIDGGHDYNTVKGDFETYSKLCGADAIIALHDIVPNKEHGEIEVWKFWKELKEKYSYEEIIFAGNEYGIGVIYL